MTIIIIEEEDVKLRGVVWKRVVTGGNDIKTVCSLMKSSNK